MTCMIQNCRYLVWQVDKAVLIQLWLTLGVREYKITTDTAHLTFSFSYLYLSHTLLVNSLQPQKKEQLQKWPRLVGNRWATSQQTTYRRSYWSQGGCRFCTKMVTQRLLTIYSIYNWSPTSHRLLSNQLLTGERPITCNSFLNFLFCFGHK